MKEVKRIGVLSVGKIFGIVGAVFGAIAGLFLALFSGALGEPFLGGNWFVQLIGLTLIYAILSFVGGVIYAALYNLVAGWVGGVQIELDDA
ncbi:MAG: hypothetical protein OXK76_18580 [Gammaproteobacteria bacterium]|nr:hypothetical protein [Gammaproteobacteria bacterium]